jgi:hypothetical protein
MATDFCRAYSAIGLASEAALHGGYPQICVHPRLLFVSRLFVSIRGALYGSRDLV